MNGWNHLSQPQASLACTPLTVCSFTRKYTPFPFFLCFLLLGFLGSTSFLLILRHFVSSSQSNHYTSPPLTKPPSDLFHWITHDQHKVKELNGLDPSSFCTPPHRIIPLRPLENATPPTHEQLKTVHRKWRPLVTAFSL